MINRRSFFLESASGAAMASAAMLGIGSAGRGAEPSTAAYLAEFVTFRLQQGTQMNSALGWLEKRALPLWQKHRFGPVGVFTVDIGPDIPAVWFIRIYASLADREAVWKELAADPDWAAAVTESRRRDQPSTARTQCSWLRPRFHRP